MNNKTKLHDSYWKQEKRLFFTDYERNKSIQNLFFPNQLVLDVGCGDGAVGEFLIRKRGNQVIGLDFAMRALKKAKSRKIPVALADVEKSLPIKSNSVDLVFLGDVIEHIYDPDRAISEISRVLKPQGRLIASCPNMGYWRYRSHYLIHGIFPETEWIQGDLWQSQHIRFFNKRLLYKLLQKKNFSIKRFIGVSRRRLDKPLVNLIPDLFGMIMVVEAQKQ
jgi:methionine biosynthesis protein MetW